MEYNYLSKDMILAAYACLLGGFLSLLFRVLFSVWSAIVSLARDLREAAKCFSGRSVKEIVAFRGKTERKGGVKRFGGCFSAVLSFSFFLACFLFCYGMFDGEEKVHIYLLFAVGFAVVWRFLPQWLPSLISGALTELLSPITLIVCKGAFLAFRLCKTVYRKTFLRWYFFVRRNLVIVRHNHLVLKKEKNVGSFVRME